ncbi:trans-sulfuration enzyme family protein [Microvirga roseola]|uniref:trans-sulfuration enzyme family protein n=1 Tax=Microvirga roseola TaxID=2883126 RepID=UPI001E325654|nr:aminotransferase class I/II-fold pyridoxal phosphate-dependent enzyme [Microvirga roseola]
MSDQKPVSHEATLALHAGAGQRHIGEPASAPPMMATSFFTHPDAVGFSANDLNEAVPHFYTRWSNPTLELLETRLAALEGGEAALSFASGMAAICALILNRLGSGDHLVLSNVCYAGVAELAHDILPKHGIAATPVDTSNPEAVAAAMRPNTKLVHIETPANPILRLSDVAAVAEIARSGGAELSVDATIATPLGMKPLALGADYVVHSLTKYICGHGDALGGAVIGRQDRIAALRKGSLIHLGGSLSPFAAWLILRGMETLAPRMVMHEANARRVEAFLADHPKVRSVFWPGSSRHPQHNLAARQMRNFSGLLAFSAKADGGALARRLAERLQVVSYAVSLGKTKSLLFYIPTDDILRSSFHLEGEEACSYRDWAGDGVFRFSVGLEDQDDIIADLDQALG